jgi:hypothetical protein
MGFSRHRRTVERGRPGERGEGGGRGERERRSLGSGVGMVRLFFLFSPRPLTL